MEYEVPELVEQSQPKRARARNLWQWLLFPLLAIVLLAGIAGLAIIQNQNSAAASRQQRDTALNVAADQQRETILLNYMDKVSDLLVHDRLLQARPSDASALAANAYTLAALSHLDPDRKADLLLFLYRTKLISNDSHAVSLREADARSTHMANTDLRDTYLVGINLSGADLRNAILSDTILTFANLAGANLTKADLHASDMHNVDLTGANLARANLRDALGLTNEQLARARSLAGATMPDGSVHP